ncbi:MAG: hypothetical protein FJ279_12150 [Planctomycetes bacterium]|nr:hypothetical protein [Planctomycetota bacterium]
MLRFTDEQVIEMVRQLPAEQKRAALLALAEDAEAQREARLKYAEARLRRLAVERGLNWDVMSEKDREALIDDLVHEGRRCAG